MGESEMRHVLTISVRRSEGHMLGDTHLQESQATAP